MNESQILSHCVVVEVTRCEKDVYWYSDLIGKQLVAFGLDSDEGVIYCCHKDNDRNTIATLPIENGRVVKGNLNELYDMN